MLYYVIKHPSGIHLLETYDSYEPACKTAYTRKEKVKWEKLEEQGYSCVKIEIKEVKSIKS